MFAHNTPTRFRRPLGCCVAVVALSWLGGCAGPRLQVQPQVSASGQPAYELRGTHLEVLRQEVNRLCPKGAEVLRETQTYERNETEHGFVKRWTVGLVEQPARSARMQVVCRA